MTSNNNSHSSKSTSSGNAKNGQNSTWVAGWEMPENGMYGLEFYSSMFKVDEKTVTKWINKYRMRYAGPNASNCYVAVNEFLSCISRGPEDEAE